MSGRAEPWVWLCVGFTLVSLGGLLWFLLMAANR